MKGSTKSKSVRKASSPSRAGLGNPLVTAAVVTQTASVIPFIIKTLILCGIGYFAYLKFTNRFVSKKYNSKLPAANISDMQAEARANSIAESIKLFSNDYDNVERNIAGLNYNGFVKLYNAFGKQTGTLLGGELDLIEWIRNQFKDYQILKLSALQNGAFF